MKIEEQVREFTFLGTVLPDPDPTMSLDEVLIHYAKQYVELKRGKVELSSEIDGKQLYELKKAKFQPDG